MENMDLRRVRQDLETVQRATGLKSTLHPHEVWLNFACIPVGLWAVVWASFASQEWSLWGLFPVLILCLGALSLMQKQDGSKQDGNEITPEKRCHFPTRTAATVGLVLLFGIWAKHLALSPLTIYSGATIGAGMVLTFSQSSLYHRAARAGEGIPFLIAGFAMPFWNVSWLIPFGLAIAATGGLLAVKQLRQLRAAETLQHLPL